ncbi:MAG TPA: glucoamylase family protein, partial [Chthonomonadales bacterium]|nr:glucoamylase family protein [Chthonomonadales bacterium]
TGARAWNCELSSIDSTLLILGALTCSGYWPNTEVSRIANTLYDRMDWTWMLTNGGLAPDKLVVSMGWKPESGFLGANWSSYCELMELYLLGLGSRTDPLPAKCWNAWARPVVQYDGFTTLAGGPLFMHQMPEGYFLLKNEREDLGWDYWVSSTAATLINRAYCIDRSGSRKTYSDNVWGLSACDGPSGYSAYGAPGDEDGTVAPDTAIASLIFTPKLSMQAADAFYSRYGARLWGRYGFSDGFNIDRNWFDSDVIGIDLGMAMVAIEDERSGLIWRLIGSNAFVGASLRKAGFRRTREPAGRPLQVDRTPAEDVDRGQLPRPKLKHRSHP